MNSEADRRWMRRIVRRLRCTAIGHVVYPADHNGKSLMRRTPDGVEADCEICGKTIRSTCGLELCGLVWCRKPNARAITPGANENENE
jgi:hypothetical protein